MKDKIVIEKRSEILTTPTPNQEAGENKWFDVKEDDLWAIERKMHACKPLTEIEEGIVDLVIGANIKGIVHLNPDTIKSFQEFLGEQLHDEEIASLGYKEFYRLILVGGITFGNKHIRDLTPEQQESMGFQFEKEDIEE